MPITLNCPKCHKPFRVRDESIGGRVRCPSCGAVLQVPAALSPASHFGTGEEPKSIVPSTADRPVAEDVPRSIPGAPPDLMLGGAGNRDDVVDLGPPGGPPLPAPPSIKARGPAPAPPPRQARQPASPPPPAPPPPSMPARAPRAERRRDPVTLGAIPAEAGAWRSVRGGLGFIQFGLFLFSLVFLGVIGHGVWVALDQENALKDGPGFLGKEGWPRWKEVMVAYTAIPITLGVLMLLLGRLRCGGAPRDAHARGLAMGAAFFTFLALVCAAVYVGQTYFDAANKANLNLAPDLQANITLSALYAGVPSIVLADILTLLFVGQIGWPLNRPKLQQSVAGFFMYALVLPAAVLIASLFFPLVEVYDRVMSSYKASGTPFGGADGDEVTKKALIWAVILLAAGAMILLRYAGVAGAGRRAIKKHLAGAF